MTKKTLLIPVSALVLTMGVIYAAPSMVSAQVSDSSIPPLAQRIAERFKLNPEEVQQVFSEYKDEMHAEHEARMLDKFDQLVSEGKITEDQRNAIVDKLTTLREEHDSQAWQSLSKEERRKKMESKHEELKAWAEAQGIELDVIMPKVMMHHKGPRGEFKPLLEE